MITFATAGKPDSFGKRKFPQELPAYLGEFGLNGFEIQCGRGFNITEEACSFFADCGLRLSLHTPYFISVSGTDETTREKSVNYILESARLADKIGARRIIVHSGSCAKISREDAVSLALDTFKKARRLLDENKLEHIIICPETMGKINQLGDLDEVIELCGFDERMLPCVDFGHLNARTFGGIKDKSDYTACFDKIADKLGQKRLRELHIHFSKIQYTQSINKGVISGGEKKHLTFADLQYGPEFEPMLDEIYERKMQPFIVCESDGTQAEDCKIMLNYYNEL